jgi:hypothetical protein
MKKLLLSLIVLLSLNSLAQEKQEKLTFTPYGFVALDAFVDSRQGVTARGGHGYLYPYSYSADANGNDQNDQSEFDYGAGITRLGFNISGPKAFGAITTAKIEGDFAGSSGNSKDFVPRLRHAFVKLKWNKSSLLAGQTWHPLFVTENYPATVSFVVGVPIHPLSRNPQIKYLYQASEKMSLSLMTLSQGDFKNSGTLDQIEMADFPEFDFQLKYGSPQSFFLAATIGVKQVQPLSLDDNSAIADGKVTSMHTNLSLRYTFPAITIKAEGVYGGNMTDQVMIGGIARKTKDGEIVNDEFEAIKTSSFWSEIYTNSEKIQFGLFAGITHNLGTAEESTIEESEYTRGSDIEYIYSYAPRVKFMSGNLCVGLEWQHTVAAYGTIDEKSKPTDSQEYANNRMVLGLKYSF